MLQTQDDVVRVGVVGCGYWGPKHLRVLEGLPRVFSIAAIDPRVERLAGVRRVLPSVQCYTSLDEALPFVDALIIATPPTTHFELGYRALSAGKHVLIEKPMATSSLDAELLLSLSRDRGVTLMAGHTFEYNAAVLKLREIVQSQTLGRLYYIDSSRLNLGLYQSDVNVLFDLAPHDVSIMNFLLDAEPTSVEAWGSRHAHPEHTDVAYLRMEYAERGVSAHIHVSWLDPCKVRRVTVVGSQKMAVYNDLESDERIRIYDKGVVRGSVTEPLGQPPMSYRYGDIVAPFMPSDEPLAVQDEHFVDCILSGKIPQSDGSVGLSVVRVLEAAQRSIDCGGPVRLDESGPAPTRAAALASALRGGTA
jgi:predicted dehydrogenase